MKNLLTKTLFISLLFPAVIPSSVQADLLTDRLMKVWDGSDDFRTYTKETTATFLEQIRGIPEYDFFKDAVATVGIVGVLYRLNYKFDLTAKIEKKRKEAWRNKWVRYTTYGTGTTLAFVALYAGLAHKGYLPGFSAVKDCLVCAWQEKSLKAPMRAYQSIPKAMQATEAVGQEIAKAAELKVAEEAKSALLEEGLESIAQAATVGREAVAQKATEEAVMKEQESVVADYYEAVAQKVADAAEAVNDMAGLAQTTEIQEPAEIIVGG